MYKKQSPGGRDTTRFLVSRPPGLTDIVQTLPGLATLTLVLHMSALRAFRTDLLCRVLQLSRVGVFIATLRYLEAFFQTLNALI